MSRRRRRLPTYFPSLASSATHTSARFSAGVQDGWSGGVLAGERGAPLVAPAAAAADWNLLCVRARREPHTQHISPQLTHWRARTPIATSYVRASRALPILHPLTPTNQPTDHYSPAARLRRNYYLSAGGDRGAQPTIHNRPGFHSFPFQQPEFTTGQGREMQGTEKRGSEHYSKKWGHIQVENSVISIAKFKKFITFKKQNYKIFIRP